MRFNLNPAIPGLAVPGVFALALATTAVVQAREAPQRPDAIDARSADLLSPQTARGLTMAKRAPSAATDAVTLADVGDVDSFGRNLRWLGVTQLNAALRSDCSDWVGPGCEVITPGAITSFSFTDLARIRLPPKATKSLLCYWVSPLVTVSYRNTTAAPVTALFRYQPTLTVENPVLDDPALINPMTGLPFGGRLEAGMTSSEYYEVPLAPGVAFTQRSRDSAVCIAGFLSRRALVDNYGLSEAQATAFFQRETVVRMNLGGAVNHVADANFVFGLRIIGD